MEKQRIVITGVGVVAPNGIGKEEFWKNCSAGVSGIKRITLFDTSKYRCHYAGEISDFQPERYLGSKGLRNFDRTTLLALVAAKLAIDDAKLNITDENRNDIGVVLGSTMGSVHSISEFDKEGLREGPRYVNPAQFPNTVINSPASQVAIRFGLRALNATISTGFTASLDAIGYALDMLRLGRAKILLVGGVEELCIQTFLGFEKLGLLVESRNGSAPTWGPRQAGSRGTLLGEGAAFFVLESPDHASGRGSRVAGEILGYGTSFSPASLYRRDRTGKGSLNAIQFALADAQLQPADVDAIGGCADGSPIVDDTEQGALDAFFSARGAAVPVAAVKATVGEPFSAGGALQVIAALDVLAVQRNGASDQSNAVKRILVTGVGPTGVSSAVVLGGAEHGS
jgi:3-oxoacyl-[acyl-carrier-protein] synthase II